MKHCELVSIAMLAKDAQPESETELATSRDSRCRNRWKIDVTYLTGFQRVHGGSAVDSIGHIS